MPDPIFWKTLWDVGGDVVEESSLGIGRDFNLLFSGGVLGFSSFFLDFLFDFCWRFVKNVGDFSGESLILTSVWLLAFRLFFSVVLWGVF